jgi:hypothetical protein
MQATTISESCVAPRRSGLPEMLRYLMQARSSTTNHLYTWRAGLPDWMAAGYTGPGLALDVALSGGGTDSFVDPNALTDDSGATITDDSGAAITNG